MANEKKLKYEEPTISIFVFETADIITASGNGFAGDIDPLYADENL